MARDDVENLTPPWPAPSRPVAGWPVPGWPAPPSPARLPLPPPFPPARSLAPSAPPRRQGPGRGWVLVAVLAFLAGAGVVLARTGQHGGPAWARSWDPRIEPLARFVERERGLTFTHPVTVELVPEDEFLAEVRQRRASGGAADPTITTNAAAELPLERAFGLVPREFQRRQSSDDAAAGVVGAYDPDTRKIRLRGEVLTPSVRVTLVHELTHALQDQRFDLRTLQGRPTSSTSAAALLGVIEGDAVAVERVYVASLSDEDRREMVREEGKVVDAPALGRVPAALLSTIQMPYVLGPSFVLAVDRSQGAVGRNALFRTPPGSDLAVLFPDRYLTGLGATATLQAPVLAAGETAVDDHRYGDDFGAFGWLTVLAGRLDVGDAVRSIKGWAGDRYVTYRKGDAVCARANVASDSPAGADALESALQRWIDAGPSGSASVSRVALVLTVSACDTGVDDPATDRRFDDPLTLLDLRDEALTAKAPAGRSAATITERACLGDALAAAVTLDELHRLSELSAARMRALVDQADAACGITS